MTVLITDENGVEFGMKASALKIQLGGVTFSVRPAEKAALKITKEDPGKSEELCVIPVVSNSAKIK